MNKKYTNMINKFSMEFKPNFTEREKNQFARQYECLVRKLVKQTVDKGFAEWDQIESAAWEGFAIAMKDYNPERSKLSFTQYAGWSIRNRILTAIDDELRTVKVSWYNRKKAEANGEKVYQKMGIDVDYDPDCKTPYSTHAHGLFKFENIHTKPVFIDGDVYEYMYSRLEETFSPEHCDIFYRSFGLNGYAEQKGKDIAKAVGLSEGAVSQKVKKIVTWMRSDAEMCEMLSNLMEG